LHGSIHPAIGAVWQDKVFGEGATLGNTFGKKDYSNRIAQLTAKYPLEMTTGGWTVSGNRDAVDFQQNISTKEYFDWMMDNVNLNFEPSSQFWLLNTNYFVAARRVEKVSGKTFTQFVKN